MRVSINQTASYRIRKKLIEKLFKTIQRLMPRFSHQEISVAFVDNKTIKKLNKTYRGINSATDVLSFVEDNKDWPLGQEYLGEIVISYPQAVRQAKKNKHSVHKEMVVLLIHGFLHLAGFDHKNTKVERRMQFQERRILSEFGVLK